MARKLYGRTTPRIWTPPQRPLTRRTSFGYDVCDFAAAAGITLYPPQKWLLIHACELDRDGLPRFRIVVVEMARQNGKTMTAMLVALFRMYVWRTKLIVGAAQSLSQARESKDAALEMIGDSPLLAAELAEVRRGNGMESFRVAPPFGYADEHPEDESLTLAGGSRFKIVASDRRAARGLSVGHLFVDELAQWQPPGWAAMLHTTMAIPDAMVWAATNMGDDRATVHNTLHDAAESGRDPHIGLFSWSAPDGADFDDMSAVAQANPLLGYRITPRAITTAIAAEHPDDARREILCQRVEGSGGVIPLDAWRACADESGTLDFHKGRGQIAVAFDAAPDGQHCSLVAAARLDDGRVRIEVVDAWDSTDEARMALPALLAAIKPAAAAWYPDGPAAAVATVLRQAIPAVRNVQYIELTGGRVSAACQEFVDMIRGRRILHPSDPLLDDDVRNAQRLNTGDGGFKFGRRGDKAVDACYAAAAATVAALALPEPRKARIRMLPA